MEEVELMYGKAYKLKEDEYRFLAAIQGVSLGEEEQEENGAEAIIRRAEAKALGMHEEEYNLDGLFEFIDEDELR
jgi:hypothetical protein